jgi:predicted 3-demethylubiquinone-9 3-methyltransferase (glyoxalase superfamily)
MGKITPFLWFDDNALEAANFYVSVFPKSKVIEATPMTVTFELQGQQFYALNGGPKYKFTEAVSFYIDCETQEEVDQYWEKLSQGGEKGKCGWLKDKYGLSWQIVPNVLAKLLNDPDPSRTQRVMDAMLAMSKIEIKALEQA